MILAAALVLMADAPGSLADFEARLKKLEAANAARLEALEARNNELQRELEAVKKEQKSQGRKQKETEQQVRSLLPLRGRIGGYLDFGFFYVSGNGTGIRPDTGYRYFPEYTGVIPDAWVFMGDPLSTAINSRGEPADATESRALTWDLIKSGGKASFIVSSLNLNLFAGLGEDLSLTGSIDFAPRARNPANPNGVNVGDFIDVKLAYAEYNVPISAFSLTLYAGKLDSLLGIEYRKQDAPDRLAVTPSLICRYTCGRPLGLKARAVFFDEWMNVMLGVTNGSYFTEYFPFGSETDQNNMKTFAGRVAVKLPVGSGLEIGASGSFGAQDFQPYDSVFQWQYGFDLKLDWRGLEVNAEFVQGRGNGRSTPGEPRCSVAPCLEFKGAYGLIGYRATNWLIPYARVDWRDALHTSGASFVYISTLMRATVGARVELGEYVVLKAEYTFNVELGRVPQFPDDVLTTSFIVRY